jgi:hypothetical protein
MRSSAQQSLLKFAQFVPERPRSGAVTLSATTGRLPRPVAYLCSGFPRCRRHAAARDTGFTVDLDATHHLVLHLHQITRVEEIRLWRAGNTMTAFSTACASLMRFQTRSIAARAMLSALSGSTAARVVMKALEGSGRVQPSPGLQRSARRGCCDGNLAETPCSGRAVWRMPIREFVVGALRNASRKNATSGATLAHDAGRPRTVATARGSQSSSAATDSSASESKGRSPTYSASSARKIAAYWASSMRPR